MINILALASLIVSVQLFISAVSEEKQPWIIHKEHGCVSININIKDMAVFQ